MGGLLAAPACPAPSAVGTAAGPAWGPVAGVGWPQDREAAWGPEQAVAAAPGLWRRGATGAVPAYCCQKYDPAGCRAGGPGHVCCVCVWGGGAPGSRGAGTWRETGAPTGARRDAFARAPGCFNGPGTGLGARGSELRRSCVRQGRIAWVTLAPSDGDGLASDNRAMVRAMARVLLARRCQAGSARRKAAMS